MGDHCRSRGRVPCNVLERSIPTGTTQAREREILKYILCFPFCPMPEGMIYKKKEGTVSHTASATMQYGDKAINTKESVHNLYGLREMVCVPL